MSNYSKFHTTKCHIIPIFTRPYITLFQLSQKQVTFSKLSHDLMSHYSNFHTTKFNIISFLTRTHIFPIVTRPQIRFFQFSHEQMLHYFFFLMNTCFIIPISTRLYIIFSQMSHEHVSYISNFNTIIYNMILNFIRPNITFSNFHTTICHIIPNCTQSHVTLFQLSHDIMSNFQIFTRTCFIIFQM